jgi:mono/diheme cytochrome c family protein
MRGWLALQLLVAGCHENKVQQPRYDPYENASLFPNGQVMQAPPAGTLDRSQTPRARPRLTRALIERGSERYGIYCAVCHGVDGRGNGLVPSRGFPHPPSYLSPDLRNASDQFLYGVITNGFGKMYSYGDRVPPDDRWAIIAWIRVLQRAQPVGGNAAG